MHLIRRSIGVLSQANTIFRMMTVMWSLSLSVMGIGLSVANQTKTESLNYGFTAVPCVATHQSIQITAPVVGQRWTEVLTMINAWNLLWIIPLAASVGTVILAIVVAGVDVEEDE